MYCYILVGFDRKGHAIELVNSQAKTLKKIFKKTKEMQKRYPQFVRIVADIALPIR